MKPEIAFVILTWNSEKVIQRCIRSVFALSSFNPVVYVVDNGSSDNTVSLIKKMQLEYTVLKLTELSENKGTTISRNIALKQIDKRTEFICVLDSDTQINESAILSMVLRFKNVRIGIVGPEMRDEAGFKQNSGRKIPTLTIKILKVVPLKKMRALGESLEFYQYPAKNDCVPIGYLMSACWVFKPELIEKIGLLDEKIFYAPEDVDFCLSCWNAGYSVVQDRNAKIIHSWQRLSRKKIFSKHNFEHIKGLIYLFRKHHYWFSASRFEKMVSAGL